MKLKLTLSEKQADVVVRALDAFARLHLGQVSVVMSDITPYHTNRPFDRDEVRKAAGELQAAFTGMSSGASYGIYAADIPDDARIAFETRGVLRNKIAWKRNPRGGIAVDFDEPTRISDEPLPVCVVLEE